MSSEPASSDEPFPPYSFVPGRFPHPVSDPAGHSFGRQAESVVPLDPADWRSSLAYRRGVTLFDHGYYWEAHEVWEGLWHAAGRRGPIALFVQGLIRLAAAGVKVRAGRTEGTVHHAREAARCFAHAADLLGDPATFLGLRFADLQAWAEAAERCARATPDDAPGVLVVFPFALGAGLVEGGSEGG